MTYTRVSSSNIAAVAYDATTSTLAVRFHSGDEYHYFNVPETEYQGLLRASSVGGYMDRNIKKRGYNYAQVR